MALMIGIRKMIAKAPVETLPQYDEELIKDAALPAVAPPSGDDGAGDET